MECLFKIQIEQMEQLGPKKSKNKNLQFFCKLEEEFLCLTIIYFLFCFFFLFLYAYRGQVRPDVRQIGWNSSPVQPMRGSLAK